jgi:hypothetical protein
MTTRRRARMITATALVTLAAAALAGCSGTGTTTAGGSKQHTNTSSSPAASSTPSASATPIGTAVDVPCDQLVTATTMTVYGGTWTLDTTPTVKDGSPAATIVAQRGEACTWTDSANGNTITVAVARLPETALTRLKDRLYQESHSVPTYTVEGYFTAVGKTGRADSFPDPYWINAESTMFTEPGAAQPVMDAVRQTLAPSATTTAPTSTGTATPGA